MTCPILREAALADAPALARVHVESWRAAYEGLLPTEFLNSLSAEKRETGWRHDLNSGGQTVLVCEDDSGVVGFVNYGMSRDDDARDRRVGEICGIYLVPDAWGKSYGRRMCDEALRGLKRDGCEEVSLWMLVGNARAFDFYRRQGFEPDGREETKATRSGIEMRVLRMRRAI